MGSIFYKNKYYTEKEFLDEQNDLENFLEHKATDLWRKRVEEEWKPGDSFDPESLDEMIALAQELVNIDLLEQNYTVREEILYNLSDIFSLYSLQGKGFVNLDKLKAVVDQLEKSFDEYLEEIL